MSISYTSKTTPSPIKEAETTKPIAVNETDTIAQTLQEGNILLILPGMMKT